MSDFNFVVNKVLWEIWIYGPNILILREIQFFKDLRLSKTVFQGQKGNGPTFLNILSWI